jgi:uncharacterized protein YjbJ (UPF0337 family)
VEFECVCAREEERSGGAAQKAVGTVQNKVGKAQDKMGSALRR